MTAGCLSAADVSIRISALPLWSRSAQPKLPVPMSDPPPPSFCPPGYDLSLRHRQAEFHVTQRTPPPPLHTPTPLGTPLQGHIK